ncbi:FGGY family carbohydrate kinase [Pseudarthrobacter sp. NPDC080039]|uniref:FGGY-family carbohydrate kinase n=1 Tax=unclassified Pseudarthrobacter TaxID=2647000 RepID=UPI00344D5278
MGSPVYLGFDVGTSSSKGVLVNGDGTVVRTAIREHNVLRPRPGHVEMHGEIWWEEFTQVAAELTSHGDGEVVAVGVSGMGPCVLLTDTHGSPLRPAILYGVDTRSTEQIDELTTEFGAEEILSRGGSALTTQAVGPKLAWVSKHEPDIFVRAKRLFMPASFLAYRLTGQYGLDFHSASQCSPLFDAQSLSWYRPWTERICPDLELPPLLWSDSPIGTVNADVPGVPRGTPVTVGTIDAWSEAVSVGAQNPGDLMLMYGTTMFLICTVAEPIRTSSMWGTIGAFEGTHNLAGGMAASGAITAWLHEMFGSPDYSTLLQEAETSGIGADGLLMLPYFAGERTPIIDPKARGAILGLTLMHRRGDLYRAALEATAFGIRHNVESMLAAGAQIDRVVAVGGGTQGTLWTQIVTDVTGLKQTIPTTTIGAAYGAAHLAARLVGNPDIDAWNPPERLLVPDPEAKSRYDQLYKLYLDSYTSTKNISHQLSSYQSSARETASSKSSPASTDNALSLRSGAQHLL